jgi:hypothetical protein
LSGASRERCTGHFFRVAKLGDRWQEYDISAASVLAMGVDKVLFDLLFYNRECVFARSGIELPKLFEQVLEVVVSWGDKSAKMCVCSGLALVKEPTSNNPTKHGAVVAERLPVSVSYV